jgi:urea carboxylase-associated protein 1
MNPSVDPRKLELDETIPRRASWAHVVEAGQTMRVVDLEGNQAIDFLLYDAHDTLHRYSAADTISAQRNVYLVTGTPLLSNEGVAMMTIVESTCAYHDTIGGTCSKEVNGVRYGRHTAHEHSCADNFLDAGLRYGLVKRDIVANVNFFMNVPVAEDGRMGITDGISAPGLYVDLRAEIDVLVLISNCPQMNNPCNGYDPTPIQVQLWRE